MGYENEQEGVELASLDLDLLFCEIEAWQMGQEKVLSRCYERKSGLHSWF